MTSEIGSHITPFPKVKIYPNPFSEDITIVGSGNKLYEFRLYDITSKQILSTAFTNLITIPTEKIKNDIYFYEVRCKNEISKEGKIVKM